LGDLIAVFENHVFLFFDRHSRVLETAKDIEVTWERWKRAVIDRQITTADGAQRYITRNADAIFLDAKCTVRLPVKIPSENLIIHKLIIAHGAKEACESFSDDNVSGSLAIAYSDNQDHKIPFPFMVGLRRVDPVHLLDSYNLAIILEELDTFYDFVCYLSAKEDAISRFELLGYCGEEDLLANYFGNYDRKTKSHFIGTKNKKITGLMIGEGEWQGFSQSALYRRKKEADASSYLWDDLLQRTAQNFLDGSLLGNADIYNSRSAIVEMAREPRFWRRALADRMKQAIRNFPYEKEGLSATFRFRHHFTRIQATYFCN
jgi:hypothetical protein